MYWYQIGQTLTAVEREPEEKQPGVVLLTSEELTHQPKLAGLERVLCHTPPARDARVCKAETACPGLWSCPDRGRAEAARPAVIW